MDKLMKKKNNNIAARKKLSYLLKTNSCLSERKVTLKWKK